MCVPVQCGGFQVRRYIYLTRHAEQAKRHPRCGPDALEISVPVPLLKYSCLFRDGTGSVSLLRAIYLTTLCVWCGWVQQS